MSLDFEQEYKLFCAASALPPVERRQYLEKNSGSAGMCDRVLALIDASSSDDHLLDMPAISLLETSGFAEQASHWVSAKGKQFGQYRIIEEIGRGGMAIVYRGERSDGSFEKQVAIKVLDRHHSVKSSAARFRQELRILGQLDTAKIAKILDAGTQDGLAYFVMEYVDGSHIDKYCRHHELSVIQILNLFLQVCEAVSLAHNSNIVHRDLKPANILVDTSGSPRLIDFGIAKVLDSNEDEAITVRGAEVMTLLYASPEQLSGSPAASLPSSDIYSLGVVLYELLTGKRPIEPPASVASYDLPRFLVETEPPPPSKHDTALAGDLDTIVLKALRKDRTERYRSVEQFASYIRLYLENRPIPEGPPNVGYRFGKFVKRNLTPIAVATVLTVTLLGGIFATLHQARIAQRRFDDVRQVATSFLFDFDEAIATVQGATEARRLVVKKGQEYLDKLATDGGDDSLREELAGAYERLAGIEGNVYGSNLGQYKQAAVTYEKALAIRKELAARHPNDARMKATLGNSHLLAGDVYFTSGSKDDAIQHLRQGVEILEGLASSGNQPIKVQSGLARGHSRLCNFLLSTGDHQGALRNCEISIRESKELVAAHPDDPAYRAVLAAALALSGNALRLDKRPKEAMSQLEFAAQEFQKLHDAQPTNNGFAKNLAGTYTVLGANYRALGETDKALHFLQKGIKTVREMIVVDPADARPKTTLAVALIQVAALFAQTNRPEEARNAAAEGLGIFRNFADQPQASPDDLNNYASFLSETSIPALKDPRTALSYSKRAVAASKKPSLVLLSTLAETYFGTGEVENAIATAKQALDANPAPKMAGEVGVRAELQKKLEEWQRLAKAKP